MKEFEIFRTGTWTSDKGVTKNYTEDDLDKLVQNYNSEDPAPIVIGHPQTNAPAFGWIEKIKRVADRLIAIPKQLNEDFVKLVKDGAFKKRSISFNPDFKLNHVGFLGAAAPAVEGLKDIQFNLEADLLNFSEDFNSAELVNETNQQSKNESVSTTHIELKNFSESLQSFSSLVSELKNNFSRTDGKQAQFNDEELSKIHSRINELQFSMQMNDFELRLNEKLAYGSLTPAMKNKIMDIVAFLQKQNFSTTDFSFDKYLTQIKSLLLEFTDSIPKIIYYENFSDKPSAIKITVDEFDDLNLDDESLQLHKKALQYMQANQGVEYVEAINKIANS